MIYDIKPAIDGGTLLIPLNASILDAWSMMANAFIDDYTWTIASAGGFENAFYFEGKYNEANHESID